MNNHLVDLLMVQRPRGTRDFTPKVMNRRLAFEQLLEECARRSGFKRIPDIEIIDADGCPGFGAKLYPIMKPEPLPGKDLPIVEQVFCPKNTCYYF